MKVKDLLGFNPEAEIGFIDDDYVFKPLEIYGWDGADDCNKNDCTDVTLKLENWVENNEK